MKDVPPLAGWPTQTCFVREQKKEQRKRSRSSHHQSVKKR